MNVRPAAVAGRFYPALAEDLIETLTEFIGAQTPGRVPKALIVPHAGYRYSGALAGRAFSLDLGEVERVVMFGPNHTAPLHGAAVPSHDYWRTPIGDVKVDTAEVRRLAERLDTAVDDEPHRSEHCLEVQIPFLQRVLGSEFKILPVLVGEMSLEASASLVRDCWGAPGTVVLVSTDLSHYLPYEQAQRMDQVTAETILSARSESLQPGSACGLYPLRGLLQVAAEEGLEIQQLGLWNSGDVAGDRQRVVGYGAYALYECGG